MTRASRSRMPRSVLVVTIVVPIVGALLALYSTLPEGGASRQNDDAPPARDVADARPGPTPSQPPPRQTPPSTPRSLVQETPRQTPASADRPAPGAPDPARTSTPTGPVPGTLGSALEDAAKRAAGTPPPADTVGGRPTPVDVTRPDLAPVREQPADAAPPPPRPDGTLTSSTSTANVRTLIEAGERALASGKLVEARVNLSRAYMDPNIASGDAEMIRQKLGAANADLVFSPKVTPGDPLTEQYTVQSGDVLEKIRKRRELTPDWHFIARVNALANPDRLKIGQKLKLVRGPFHAIVHKSDFRLDLFAGSPDDPASWLFIRSFRVGLGAEESGTPLGTFKIRNRMANPWWINPRTRERFDANDPKNPIGEHWLGWEGLGDSKVHTGFGLHGTIEPESIGQRRSMGCVRMLADDIALMYELLAEDVSIVKVVP
ncbi:MAG: L,D-transpeptidase family protein [Planctomycetota bacterium]|nr:L,D-transpeptidase family protein [Planctomycetota bacterium]